MELCVPLRAALIIASACLLDSRVAGAGDWVLGGRAGEGFGRPSVSDTSPLPVTGGWGVTVGGYVGYRITPTLSLQFDVLYASKRFSSTELASDSPVESTWIDAPLIAEVVLGQSRLRPALIGGAQFSFKLGATREFRGETQDIEDELSDTDFGLVVGGRMTPLPSVPGLSVEARLQWGLVNLDETDWYEIRSRTFSFLVSYGFG